MSIVKNRLTKRSLSALETKNNIFNTALLLFAQYGFDKVTVDDITKYAGVSKGSFYTHFESKESVLVDQFRKIDNHYEQVFKNVPPNESAGNRLLILVGAMTDYCANVCGLGPLKVVYASQISPGINTKILINQDRRFYVLIRDIVKRG
ncbi:MAG: TetR/AcrR family transcriptional regulator, partial [Candidatus Taylorbacteria bacterium]